MTLSVQQMAAVGAILDELGQQVEGLGAVLCSDAAFVARHAVELQAFDSIVQKQRSLAALLLAECPRSAFDRIGIDDLKAQLTGTGAWQQT